MQILLYSSFHDFSSFSNCVGAMKNTIARADQMKLLTSISKTLRRERLCSTLKTFISPCLHLFHKKFLILNSPSSLRYQSLNYMIGKQIQPDIYYTTNSWRRQQQHRTQRKTVMCKVFASSLSSSALVWFSKLPPRSIGSFA